MAYSSAVASVLSFSFTSARLSEINSFDIDNISFCSSTWLYDFATTIKGVSPLLFFLFLSTNQMLLVLITLKEKISFKIINNKKKVYYFQEMKGVLIVY